MKLYYGPLEPDADDLDGPLGEMIAKNVVPVGCKLGGFLIEKEHLAGRDPCQSICPHEDRDEAKGGCGGRTRVGGSVAEAAREIERIGNQASDARKLLRFNQRQELDRLVAKRRGRLS